MNKLPLNNKGFGVLGVLAIIVVLAVAGGAGVYAYHRNHKAKTVVTTSKTTTTNGSKAKTSQTGKSSTSQTSKSTATTPADPYAGWKTYTDTTYHYSFKYPADWSISSGTNLPGVALRDPANTVVLQYVASQPQGDAIGQITPTSITKIASTNEDLTIVGGYGYNASIGQYGPFYEVVNTSTLNSYPLTVGKESNFPGVPEFSLEGTSALGGMSAAPVSKISTLTAAQGWLNSSDAKTSLLILESLTYYN